MDELRIVFECEYCYSLLDLLTTSHNFPCEEAPSILRGSPHPEFRNGKPGNRWFSSFLKRNKNIKLKQARKIEAVRLVLQL